jgi:hypothetical protein
MILENAGAKSCTSARFLSREGRTEKAMRSLRRIEERVEVHATFIPAAADVSDGSLAWEVSLGLIADPAEMPAATAWGAPSRRTDHQ